MTHNQLAEDIKATRDYIAENGWYQGNYQSPENFNRCCIRGASLRATKDINRVIKMRTFLAEMIKEMGIEGWDFVLNGNNEWVIASPYPDALDPRQRYIFHEPVAEYNDRVLKSKNEALEFLDKAHIAALEKV